MYTRQVELWERAAWVELYVKLKPISPTQAKVVGFKRVSDNKRKPKPPKLPKDYTGPVLYLKEPFIGFSMEIGEVVQLPHSTFDDPRVCRVHAQVHGGTAYTWCMPSKLIRLSKPLTAYEEYNFILDRYTRAVGLLCGDSGLGLSVDENIRLTTEFLDRGMKYLNSRGASSESLKRHLQTYFTAKYG